MNRRHGVRFLLMAGVYCSVVLANPSRSRAEQIKHTYDAANRLIRTEYGNGSAIDYGYDATGNIVSKTVATAPPACTGDCDGKGTVTVDEILMMVNIALGNSAAAGCVAGDSTADGLITVDEILTAVNYALNGCQVVPPTVAPGTRTPTPSPTRTTSPSPSVTVPSIVTVTPSRTPTVTSTAARSATATATVSATRSPTTTQTVAATTPTRTGTVGFATPTVQPPPTAMPTRTVSGTPAAPTPIRTPGEHVYCDTLTGPLAIPDSDENGVNDLITIADDVTIAGLRVEVEINHTWVGDLVVTLVHVNTLTRTTLTSRPGAPPFGCGGDNIACVFDDTALTHADDQCADPPPAIAGIVAPTGSLSVFNDESSAGDWRLSVTDHGGGDTGTLVHWCVEVQ